MMPRPDPAPIAMMPIALNRPTATMPTATTGLNANAPTATTYASEKPRSRTPPMSTTPNTPSSVKMTVASTVSAVRDPGYPLKDLSNVLFVLKQWRRLLRVRSLLTHPWFINRVPAALGTGPGQSTEFFL